MVNVQHTELFTTEVNWIKEADIGAEWQVEGVLTLKKD